MMKNFLRPEFILFGLVIVLANVLKVALIFWAIETLFHYHIDLTILNVIATLLLVNPIYPIYND